MGYVPETIGSGFSCAEGFWVRAMSLSKSGRGRFGVATVNHFKSVLEVVSEGSGASLARRGDGAGGRMARWQVLFTDCRRGGFTGTDVGGESTAGFRLDIPHGLGGAPVMKWSRHF